MHQVEDLGLDRHVERRHRLVRDDQLRVERECAGEPDPLTLMKAAKNEVEIAATRRAHVRDGVALTKFLAWFDGLSTAGRMTEIDAAVELERLRAEQPGFRDISFPTISAAGPRSSWARPAE